VKKFVTVAYARAKSVLTANREALLRISEALLEREVLDASEVKLLIENKPLPELVRHTPQAPPPETVQVLKPQPAQPGMPTRERPQPA
jgi:cell division protease FtsH